MYIHIHTYIYKHVHIYIHISLEQSRNKISMQIYVTYSLVGFADSNLMNSEFTYGEDRQMYTHVNSYTHVHIYIHICIYAYMYTYTHAVHKPSCNFQHA